MFAKLSAIHPGAARRTERAGILANYSEEYVQKLQ
jgi:hypothetical protein